MSKAQRTIKEQFMNKVYYLPLANYSVYWNDFTDNATKFKGYTILSQDLTDNMTYRIEIDKKVSVGYSVEYLKKEYLEKQYESIESYINDTYKPLTIGIINSMYSGMRKKKDGSYIPLVNYESVKTIVNNHFVDNLTDDLFNTTYMTLWINKEYIQCDNNYYSIGNITNDIVYKRYDTKLNDFIDISNCNSLYLACYKAVSSLLYNQKTKHDKKCIMSLYDTDNKETEYTVDSYAFKQAIMDKTTEKAMNNVNTICKNVMDYIKAMEKPFIYHKCYKVMVELQKGLLLKDIAKNLNYSINSVTKYRNIIVNAYKTLYKQYVYDLPQRNNLAATNKIVVDFTECNDKTPKNIIDLCIDTLKYTTPYTHKELQAIYNDLFYYDISKLAMDVRGVKYAIGSSYGNNRKEHYKQAITNYIETVGYNRGMFDNNEDNVYNYYRDNMIE